MKKLGLLLLLLNSISLLAANNIISSGFFIQDIDKTFLKQIKNKKGLIIDHVSSKGFELYGDNKLESWLVKNSPVLFYKIDNNIHKSALQNYPNPEQIERTLKTLAKQNPSIFKLFSIGKTQEGRELWVMKVSDNVEVDETEPEFKYVANMHGDEIVGREMMVSLLEDLAKGYSESHQNIVELINNTEIFIMPSLNPDGASKRRRGNSNWRDLNRDFPDVDSDADGIRPRQRQLETLAMMNFQESRNFSLSANFHGGTEVVNYPWDTKRADFPLLELVKDLSLEYAQAIPSMRDNDEFTDGIVNGYAWYEINGGMQDWSYHWHNDLQVTIELSHSKWPSYSQVPGYYQKNKSSLLTFMKRIHQGLGLKFNKKIDGNIVIRKLIGNNYQEIISMKLTKNEFYKVLEPGNYQLDIQSNGVSKTIYKEVLADKIFINGEFETVEF
ncbi:M14 family zinc carboxypeptidase [Halobacteriovorax sp. HLS]|uniref:M14 family zinc carboxypeptidase n=1 Tax=Halobacteriovorax sp. HLS TaxID=2234000 RepID=UPI000FD76C46|nr:M14 family zinc carboxypeptidase [Halobacteriovorax sp. HLS]